MRFEEALAAVDSSRSSKCSGGRWLDTLDADTLASIETALETMPVYRVWRACTVMGAKMSNSTFERHYKKVCRCFQ